MDRTERFFAAMTAVGLIGLTVALGWLIFFT
jgi:hypothetical protein